MKIDEELIKKKFANELKRNHQKYKFICNGKVLNVRTVEKVQPLALDAEDFTDDCNYSISGVLDIWTSSDNNGTKGEPQVRFEAYIKVDGDEIVYVGKDTIFLKTNSRL